MFDHDLIAIWLLTSLAGGVGVHAAAVWFYRRSYARLRAAYVDAVGDVQRMGSDPGALVRAQELHRQFMRACIPSWALGVGAHVRNALVIGAIVSLALAATHHRIEPVLLGVVLLFAIGLRRILLVIALLLAVFAATRLSTQRSEGEYRSAVARADGPRAAPRPALQPGSSSRASRSR